MSVVSPSNSYKIKVFSIRIITSTNIPGNGEVSFDNAYYRLMISNNINWVKADKNNLSPGVDAAKWQFDGFNVNGGGGPRLMLNTDFEVFYDVILGANAEPMCDVNVNANPRCPNAASFALASSFANVSICNKYRLEVS